MSDDDLYRACAALLVPYDAVLATGFARRPAFRDAIDHAAHVGREQADAENHDRGYRVGYDIGYAEGRAHADAERVDTCGTRDMSCTCPPHGTDAPAQPDDDGTLEPIEQALYEHFRYLDCPVVVDPVDTEDCAGMAVEVVRFLRVGGWLMAPDHATAAPAQTAASGTTPPGEGDPVGAGTSGAQRGAQAVVDVNICRRSERVDHLAARAEASHV